MHPVRMRKTCTAPEGLEPDIALSPGVPEFMALKCGEQFIIFMSMDCFKGKFTGKPHI